MTIPLVVPVCADLARLAPQVQAAVRAVLSGMTSAGFRARVLETVRTPARQEFLFGKGRSADACVAAGVSAQMAWPTCADGIVTKAAHADQSWHGYGLACDIGENDASPWTASQAFWNTLGQLARTHGLTWGGDWRFLDLPHVQWRQCPTSPSAADKALLATTGPPALWTRYGATAGL